MCKASEWMILVRPAAPETRCLLEEKGGKEESRRNELEGIVFNPPDKVAAADQKEDKTVKKDEESCLTCGQHSRKVSVYYVSSIGLLESIIVYCACKRRDVYFYLTFTFGTISVNACLEIFLR